MGLFGAVIGRTGAHRPIGRLVNAAVVAAAPPVEARVRVALMASVAAVAAVLVVVVRAARRRAVSVDDQRTGTCRHPAMLKPVGRDDASLSQMAG
jgi:hypothetical protein